MSSMWGNRIHLSLFGESHGPAIGCVVDGLPAGILLDLEALRVQLDRRRPQGEWSTARREADEPTILSGLLNGITTGAPLAMIMKNEDARPADYDTVLSVPRPSHADYPASVRYRGFEDLRGGGHLSGRLTAPLVFAGSVCRQILAAKGVEIGGHIARIGSVCDLPFDGFPAPALCRDLSCQPFPLIDSEREAAMKAAIADAAAKGDSVGGEIEVAVTGLPAGIGSPIADGVESRISSLLFGIPAIKGVSFGDGFSFAKMHGSEANDGYVMKNGKPALLTNHNGGILGGITTGAPLIVRVAVKPTPSIALPQPSVNLKTGENTTVSVAGRHDPCIVPRAVSAVEAAVAFAILDLWEEQR